MTIFGLAFILLALGFAYGKREYALGNLIMGTVLFTQEPLMLLAFLLFFRPSWNFEFGYPGAILVCSLAGLIDPKLGLAAVLVSTVLLAVFSRDEFGSWLMPCWTHFCGQILNAWFGPFLACALGLFVKRKPKQRTVSKTIDDEIREIKLQKSEVSLERSQKQLEATRLVANTILKADNPETARETLHSDPFLNQLFRQDPDQEKNFEDEVFQKVLRNLTLIGIEGLEQRLKEKKELQELSKKNANITEVLHRNKALLSQVENLSRLQTMRALDNKDWTSVEEADPILQECLELTRARLGLLEEIQALKRSLSIGQQELFEAKKGAVIGLLVPYIEQQLRDPMKRIEELLQSCQVETESQERQMKIALNELKRARELLENFGSNQKTPSGTCLVGQVLESIEDASRLAGQLVDFETDPQIERELVNFSAGQLQQVLGNLIKNGLDASPGPTPVLVRTSLKGEDIWIEVKDKGKGIPRKIAGQIYDPFFTTKEVGEGTGLGLTITKQLVEAAGGRISFQSQTQGTAFRIVLPLSPNGA